MRNIITLTKTACKTEPQQDAIYLDELTGDHYVINNGTAQLIIVDKNLNVTYTDEHINEYMVAMPSNQQTAYPIGA